MELWGLTAHYMQSEQISMVIRSQIYFLMMHQDVVLRVLMSGKETVYCQEALSYHLLGSCCFFSCVIIIAKSCLMAAWYFYLFMDRWSPGIKVMIYSKGINHALITSTRDGQWHWESLTVLYLNDVSYLCEQNSWIITTCGAFPFRSEKLNQSLMIALADIKWNLHG